MEPKDLIEIKESNFETIKKNPNGVYVFIGRNKSKSFHIKKIMEQIENKKSKTK